MNKLVLGVVLCLVTAAAIVVWLRARPGLSDKAQVANLILEVKQAVETKNAGAVLRHVADNYDDGTYKKRDITGLVVGGFRNPEAFRVHVEAPQIEVTGERAQARVHADFEVGGPGAGGEPTRLDVLLELVKARGTWKVVRASGWEPAMEAAQ